VLPVRIGSHAFGRGLPVRDLFLSPDHAVFAEGALQLRIPKLRQGILALLCWGVVGVVG
jgi:hypothetical protein